MNHDTTVVWLRRDLRVTDNLAFTAAAATSRAIVPLFVIDPRLWDGSGHNRTRFLVDCLDGLRRALDGSLVVRTGDPAKVLPEVVSRTGASLVIHAGDVSPLANKRDEAVRAALAAQGVATEIADWPWAVPPETLFTKSGTPFKVFTPYFRTWLNYLDRTGLPDPAALDLAKITNLNLPSDKIPDAPSTNSDVPRGGEAEAHQRWEQFLNSDLAGYNSGRDDPGADSTSRLSPYLKFGCIHPRQLLADLDLSNDAHRTFASELAWRDFYATVLHHWPHSAWRDWKDDLAGIKVNSGPESDRQFDAWRRGETGFPLVDAGMRQLLAEGWMHNRVRMLTASFLVKDLHLHWSLGARHFMRHLVDGDLSSNNHGWQWAAGTGTDAAPYFRVFNPITQSEKFDPDGDYIRRYIPELRAVEGKAVHRPWTLPEGPPDGYPSPIVDHAVERQVALDRYQATRG